MSMANEGLACNVTRCAGCAQWLIAFRALLQGMEARMLSV